MVHSFRFSAMHVKVMRALQLQVWYIMQCIVLCNASAVPTAVFGEVSCNALHQTLQCLAMQSVWWIGVHAAV